jgi:NAD(P)-dependent dehydrogenase (short-subunit alcohol dehydrogenase family)
MQSFQDKIAVVTGASSGVGKALALRLAAEGARVCLVGRNLMRLEAAFECTSREKERLRPYVADLTIDSQISQFVEQLKHDYSHIDILIHSAGVISMGPTESSPVEDLDSQYRCNVRGPYVLTQALLPLLRARPGQIVFINSSAGITAKAGVGQYAASKHALKALADSLREEVNPEGVRVLSVYLGRTATPMQQEVHRYEGRPYRTEWLIQPEEVASLLVNLLSVQNSAEVTDITLRPLHKPIHN